MLGFLLGKKGKFKLSPGKLVELEFSGERGTKSFFTEIGSASDTYVIVNTPTDEHKRTLPLTIGQIIKSVSLIEDTIFEVNLKVTEIVDSTKFEALISKNIFTYKTDLKKFDKPKGMPTEGDFNLSYRTFNTPNFSQGKIIRLFKKSIEIESDTEVPEKTLLKLRFETPDSPDFETEGTLETIETIQEEPKKYQAKIELSEKAILSDLSATLAQYYAFYKRREERRNES